MLPSTFKWVLVQNFIMWSFLSFWLCSKLYTISYYCAVYIVYLYFFRVSKAVRLYSTHFNSNSGFLLLCFFLNVCGKFKTNQISEARDVTNHKRV